MEKGQEACRRETTKLGLTGAANHSPLLPATKSTERRLEPRACETAPEHSGVRPLNPSWKGNSSIRFKGECCEEAKREILHLDRNKVQDLSLDFLKGSESVIISCWALYMNNTRRTKQTVVVTSRYGQTVMSVFRNLSCDKPTPTTSVLIGKMVDVNC